MNRRLFEDSETNVLLLKSFFLKSLLNLAIAHIPNFPSGNLVDMSCGVGTQLLRKLFLFYLELLVRRMLQLRIMWSLWVASISGACAFLEKRMIGKWIPLLLFSRYCTRSVLIEVVKTNCGGSPPKKVCSRLGLSLALWLAM
jgi:hypothetical protein